MIGARRYFSPRYWASRYWPKTGHTVDYPGSIAHAVAAVTSAVHSIVYATATLTVAAITSGAASLGEGTATISVQAIGSATHTVAPAS